MGIGGGELRGEVGGYSPGGGGDAASGIGPVTGPGGGASTPGGGEGIPGGGGGGGMRGSSSERTRHCSMANPARMAYTTWRKRDVQGMTILPSAEHAALRDGHPRAPQETIPRVSGAHLRAAMTERLGRVPPRAMTWHDLYLSIPTRTSACSTWCGVRELGSELGKCASIQELWLHVVPRLPSGSK